MKGTKITKFQEKMFINYNQTKYAYDELVYLRYMK